MVRNPAWQHAFLAKPLVERARMAQDARGQSEQAKQVKDLAIMDVAPATVTAVLRSHAYPRLIHGHTHRPARHEHVVDGRLCERWVLSDWYGQGSYCFAMRPVAAPCRSSRRCRQLLFDRPRAKSAWMSDDGFQSHRDTQQTLANSGGLACLRRNAPVRGAGRMGDRGLGIAEVRGDGNHLGRIDHCHAASRPPFTSNETMPPPLFCWRIAKCVLRMRSQPRVIDSLHFRVLLQPLRQLQRRLRSAPACAGRVFPGLSG